MVLVNKLKTKRECEAPAGGSKREVAANAELESADNNERSGTKFFFFFLLASAVTENHSSALCGVLVKLIRPKKVESRKKGSVNPCVTASGGNRLSSNKHFEIMFGFRPDSAASRVEQK